MDLDLQGKICLVTGASRGLGFATAHLLASEGAKVAINARDSQKLDQAAQKIKSETGAEVLSLPGDVTDPQVPDLLLQALNRNWQGLDILITNSGGPPAGSFETFTDAQWESALNLSLMSHVRLIRSALPLLRNSSTPSVLTVTSVSVKQPIVNLVLSNSIRAATVGLTKSLALELGKEGIRFNSILPGWTETERVEELMQNRAEAGGTSVEEEMQKQASSIALGRLALPEEFARAAVFLVSPAASYITGVMLTVDGGAYKGTF